ncbi:unnamed protein product [Rhodiola kirilowii]
MSRLAKWKYEKIKVKVVFRLQFHATHVPQTGWDKLFISFIPVDSGKATAKTTKANVRNGICKWGDPIYETTRLLQDANTKQYDEKLCRLVVMMGTSRSSILGEAMINLANYAEASKPSTVALPLHGCDSGTTLNVTIQLLTSKTGFREFEQQRELTDKGVQRAANQNSHDNGTGKESFSEGTHNDRTDKVNARVRFKSQPKEVAAFEEIRVTEYVDLAAGCDESSNTSESLHAEKHDILSSHEVDSIKSTVSGDLGGNSSTQSPRLLKGDSSELLKQASSEWVHGWSSDYSVDNELVIANEENSNLRGSLEVEECNIIHIKSDVLLLQNCANELCSDTQKFANQLASELASGQDLQKEVLMLKSEYSQLKDDLERLKAVKFSSFKERPMSKQDQPFHNIKHRWLDGLSLLENKVRELQNKTSTGFQEGGFSFLGPDLEILLSALHELRQINGPESGADSVGFVSCGADSLDVTNALRDKIFELLRDLDESKAEGESLARKMDQMECYYENLIHELEENQKLMAAELHNLRSEHSNCVYTLSVSKSQMDAMHQDFSEQIARYAEDRRELDELNKELEKRLSLSETALKRARLNYSIAVDQLQKDLETLSLQVISMHQTNESLIKQAFPNPQQSLYGDPEIQQDMEASEAVQHLQRHYRDREVHKQPVGRDMVSEGLKASLQFREQLYHKIEAEVCEMQLTNLELDFFATALRETLLEVSGRVVCINDAADELSQQLVLAVDSREFLMRRLQSTEDDLQALNDLKNSCIDKCEKVDLLNRSLEAKLESLASENHLLSQKILESESLVTEFGVNKEKYEACDAEKRNLEKLLTQECTANESLTIEVSAMHEKLSDSEDKCLELASLVDDMSDTISYFENKVRCMLQSYGENFHDLALSLPIEHPDKKLGIMDLRMIIAQLELSQNYANDKILVLMDENRKLMEEREAVAESLNMKSSEVFSLKKKLRNDLLDMYNGLQKSDATVQKLQLDLEAFAERTMLPSDTEVTNALQEFLSHLEDQIQAITSGHNDFAQEIFALENIVEELDRSRKVLSELQQENQLVKGTLQETINQSMELKAEVDILEDSMTSLKKELHLERCHCGKLESQVAALAQKLNEASNQVPCLEHKLLGLEAITERLVISFEFEEKLSQLEDEIANRFSVLQTQLKDVTLESNDLAVEILALQSRNEDLESNKLTVYELTQENKVLGKSLQERVDVSMQLEAEIVSLSEKSEGLNHELNRERDTKTKVESIVAGLTQEKETLIVSLQEKADEILKLEAQISTLTQKSENLDRELICTEDLKQKAESRAEELTCQLNEKSHRMLDFDQQKDALTQQVLFLESEKSRLSHLLKNHEERLLIHEKSSSVADLEIDELHGLLLADDVKLFFLQTQYESSFFKLFEQLKSSYGQNEALHSKCLHLDTRLNECLTREASYVEDNAILSSNLESFKSDLEASVAQNQILLQLQSDVHDQIGQYKDKVASLELCSLKDNDQHALNMQELSISFGSSENQTDSLLSLSEMLSIQVLVLKSKLNEMLPQFTLLGSFKDEVTKLKVQCTDLTQRLSQEIMKAEEFKSLSVHFKELKDKAEAQCARAFEKNELEGRTMARQDSLRVAFIKEQCETQIQELKQQLCISKKHSDEMLWKLQDAINETESRKKSEASYLKKIEELSAKILQLETELERAVSDKREKAMDIDRMQAELDCSLISLECCKEEKQKIEALLLQCEVENVKRDAELASVKEELKCCIDRSNLLKESGDSESEANNTFGITGSRREISAHYFLRKGNIYDVEPQSPDQDKSISFPGEDENSKVKMHAQQEMQPRVDQSIVMGNGVNNSDCATPKFQTQSLRSSMEQLQNELEKMKRENSDLQDGGICEPTYLDLQKEIMLLDKANEELGNQYPFYNEFTDNRNALERVLALELELAEALQAKKKSTFNFQSSFLKMHGDEDAVFKSFRDVNELIKEMLEIKGRYSSVENELKEMRDRYSQLSLQFAEVEGERQKLTMLLKNVRGSKRNFYSSRSGSPILADSSP